MLEATESVNELSKELAVKEKELAVASKEAELVLADVAVKAASAEKVIILLICINLCACCNQRHISAKYSSATHSTSPMFIVNMPGRRSDTYFTKAIVSFALKNVPRVCYLV